MKLAVQFFYSLFFVVLDRFTFEPTLIHCFVVINTCRQRNDPILNLSVSSCNFTHDIPFVNASNRSSSSPQTKFTFAQANLNEIAFLFKINECEYCKFFLNHLNNNSISCSLAHESFTSNC